jgi:hypothetical protein
MMESPVVLLHNNSSHLKMQVISWGSYCSSQSKELVKLTGVRKVDPK